MDSRAVVEWKNLPKDMLSMIAERSEIRQLRAVCSSWRSSLPIPLSNKSPLLSVKIPFPLFDKNQLRDAYLTLSERNIFYLEPLVNDTKSPKSWMVKLEETCSGKMRFLDILSNRQLSLESRRTLPAVVSLFDCRVLLAGKEYNLSCSHKVVLSDDAMLCIFGNGKLGYFKIGDENWTMIDHGDGEISDIIHHKERFYGIDSTGKIIVVDSALKVEVFASQICEDRTEIDSSKRLNYFVESNGDLFVLSKYYEWYVDIDLFDEDFVDDEHHKLVLFKVHRLNSNEIEWVEVRDLGDQTFFIGHGCSFSVSSQPILGPAGCSEQSSGRGRNVICCADDAFVEGAAHNGEPGFDVGISDLEENFSGRLQMFRQYSRLFWPVPSWLKPQESPEPPRSVSCLQSLTFA